MRRRLALVSTVLLSAVAVVPLAPASAAPPAPMLSAVIRGNASITVEILTIDSPPGSTPRYQARCISDDTLRVSEQSTETSIVVGGLKNRVLWECSGRARIGRKWSPWSTPLTMKPSKKPATAPKPPALGKVLAGPGLVTVSFTPSANNGGATVKGYDVRCVTGSFTVSLSTDSTRATIDGLVENEPYECSVTASNPIGESASSRPQSVTVTASALEAGAAHTCAVRYAVQTVCWGYNEFGQGGTGSSALTIGVGEVLGADGPFAIASGGVHSCAVLPDRTVSCWGDNIAGQLGDGTKDQSSSPKTVPGLTNVTALALGAAHSCALVETGNVFCWGANNSGQLGDGSSSLDRTTPGVVAGLSDAVRITAGDYHTCALRATGTVVCWGFNQKGAIGDGTTDPRRTPTPVSGLTGVRAITGGGYHTCALLDTGTASCWGFNDSGQLGDGSNDDQLVPVAVSGLTRATTIVAGGFHTCALLTDLTMSCWGSNNTGQQGSGPIANRNVPGAVPGLGSITSITAGSYHTCAMESIGAVWCWGSNAASQLGDGSTIDMDRPIQVIGFP